MQPHQIRRFNTFLGITDPAEFLGIYLSNFSIALNYPLNNEYRDELKTIREQFYETLSKNLDEGSIEKVKHHLIDYKDAKLYGEEPRRYLKVELSTARNTQITALVRCLIKGDNLYVAVDSYVLGSLRVADLVIQIVIAFVGFAIANTFPPVLILVLVYLFFTWIDVFRATRQKADFLYGLRCKFNKSMDLGSFNTDDTLMFLKSLLPMVTSTIRQVFLANGMSIESIEDVLKNIEKKVSGQTISMEAGGNISLFGANIASYNSQANSS